MICTADAVPDGYVKLSAAARARGLGRASVWAWAAAGAVPAVKVGGRVYVDAAACAAYAAPPVGKPPGSRQRGKLTRRQVEAARRRLSGKPTLASVAKEMGVSQGVLWYHLNKK